MRRAADGDDHLRAVTLVDHGRENLPGRIERIGHGNGRKGRPLVQSARREHFLTVIIRRGVRFGIEFECLRISPVPVYGDVGSGKNGILVENIDGKIRPGESVIRLIILQRDFGGIFCDPLRIQPVPLRGSRRGTAPENIISDKAGLLRRLDHGADGNIGGDHHAVVVLLICFDRLLDHRADFAVHLGIVARLILQTVHHVSDIFDPRMLIGRAAVRRQLIADRLARKIRIEGNVLFTTGDNGNHRRRCDGGGQCQDCDFISLFHDLLSPKIMTLSVFCHVSV